MNNNNALWLPENSVRAILAIMLTAAAIVSVFVKVPEGSMALLFGGAGTCWGLYFGKRAGEKKPES